MNKLIELWVAVHQRESNKFGLLAKELDLENIPFTIQNRVADDGYNTRNKKQVDIFKVKQRVENIVNKYYLNNNNK
tara:strand:+ start:519 stop:746 length:228 start_codon:yes stop_codon:yes gene_type:complete